MLPLIFNMKVEILLIDSERIAILSGWLSVCLSVWLAAVSQIRTNSAGSLYGINEETEKFLQARVILSSVTVRQSMTDYLINGFST